MSNDGQRYHVIDRIAAGGMAEVYRGESAGIEGFRKKVAIKRVLPKLSENRDFIDMFLDEARLCAYLNHSKCVQVFDIGQGAGSHFIVMEYVDGADLKAVLEHLDVVGERLAVEVACRITLDICEGLAYAHDATDHAGQPLEIVHRDISPHNVLLTRHGEVKLVDFGLAKASSHLTADEEDIVKGKFGYLAPEITEGKGADRRVDIFAAGILLWEMIAGRRLFKGASDIETFKLVRAAQIPDLRTLRDDVPDVVMQVVSKALARDPADRYRDAHAFARDLGIVLLHL
jgi:eukaryotic-like serine/threonine-protein kinase